MASFASSFQEPIYRKFMHHDTKFPRTARSNYSVKNFTSKKSAPFTRSRSSPTTYPLIFTRPKVFEPAGSLGKFHRELFDLIEFFDYESAKML